MKKDSGEQLPTIEELEKKEKVNHAVHVAICKRQGWNPGKRVSLADYQKAVKLFLTT